MFHRLEFLHSYIYTWKFRLSIPYDEFVPILKSASRPHSSTVPLPTLASSNLEALPLVGWAPRSAANGPLRVPSSRESRRNESECASSKRSQALTGCPHVFLLANSTRGGHTEKPSATQQQSPPPHASTSRSARASVAWQARARQATRVQQHAQIYPEDLHLISLLVTGFRR